MLRLVQKLQLPVAGKEALLSYGVDVFAPEIPKASARMVLFESAVMVIVSEDRAEVAIA